MAYCEELRMERQCKATRKDGKPCRGYAVWGGVKCVFHGGQPEPGEPGQHRRPNCHCGTNGEGGGYLFPHKLGGGRYCVYSLRWVKPTYTIGPSQHSFPRLWGYEKVLARLIENRWRGQLLPN